MVKFCHCVIDNTFVVWLDEAHRFVQLQEPAFFVFEQWAAGKDQAEIGKSCSDRYHLPENEASRFVREIIGETEKLFPETEVKEQVEVEIDSHKSPPRFHSKHRCRFGHKTIIFRYGDEMTAEQFQPVFAQFENLPGIKDPKKGESEDERSIDLYTSNGDYCIDIEGKVVRSYHHDEWEHFHSAVYTELLELLYEKKMEDWMGIFHASAMVPSNLSFPGHQQGALIFTGGSGSGKSTIAALLMANGYRFISDDFLPVAIPCPPIPPLIYPLPTAISIKRGAFPVLSPLFSVLQGKTALPGHKNDKEEIVDGVEEFTNTEFFLPLSGNAHDLSPVPAQAIVFIKYDPSVEFSLSRESNLEMMNDFLKQSWIASNAVAAQAFLDWYFSLPVYSLVYFDAEQMVEGLKHLFISPNP